MGVLAIRKQNQKRKHSRLKSDELLSKIFRGVDLGRRLASLGECGRGVRGVEKGGDQASQY